MKNIEGNLQKKQEKQRLREANGQAIQAAWKRLKDQLEQLPRPLEQNAHLFAPIDNLVVGQDGDKKYTLELELKKPGRAVYQELASLSVAQSESSTWSPRELSSVEVNLSKAEGKVELPINTSTVAEMQSKGLAQGLTTLLDELVGQLLKIYPESFPGNEVVVVRSDEAHPAVSKDKKGPQVARRGWTTAVALSQGFERDREDPNTFVKTYRRS